MSLILDALKKAEAERQRQTGPTLLEVRVTQAPRRLPVWTLVIGGLLAVNILLLLVFALRRPATSAAATPVAASVPAAAAPIAAPAPAPAAALPAPSAPPAALSAPAAASANAAPALAPPASDMGAAGDTSERNPADDAPAIAARNAPAHKERDRDSPAASPQSLPNLSDLGAEMPDLRLDLHVFAERPASRYALINMHTVHEGDVLPEGPSVVEIYRDGVELSYHGTQFMLRPQ
jgi:general secretion pathway protein B